MEASRELSLSGTVQIGSQIEIAFSDGEVRTLRLDPTGKSSPGAGVISSRSPLALALLGAREGERRTYVVEQERNTVTVLSVVAPGEAVSKAGTVGDEPMRGAERPTVTGDVGGPVATRRPALTGSALQKMSTSKSEVPEVLMEARVGPLPSRQFAALSAIAWKAYCYLGWRASQMGSTSVKVTQGELLLFLGAGSANTVTKALKDLVEHQLIRSAPRSTGTTVTLLPPPKQTPDKIAASLTKKVDDEPDKIANRIAELERQLEEAKAARDLFHRLLGPAAALAGEHKLSTPIRPGSSSEPEYANQATFHDDVGTDPEGDAIARPEEPAPDFGPPETQEAADGALSEDAPHGPVSELEPVAQLAEADGDL